MSIKRTGTSWRGCTGNGKRVMDRSDWNGGSMKSGARVVTRLLAVIMLVGGSLAALRVDAQSPAQGLTDQRIEIVMREYDFQVVKPTPIRPGVPAVIILRNQDIVRHGFYSSVFLGVLVQGEGEGVAAYGKGVEGFYVEPGKTLVIRFVNERPGKYSFRCDLHPQMKGEMYLMEVPAT